MREGECENFPVLKGPKLEIFGSRVFTQIRPVWVGDLGTRPKYSKFWLFRLENCHFVLSHAVADKDKKILSAVVNGVKNLYVLSATTVKNIFFLIKQN